MDPNAQKVIDNCQFYWPAHQGDCSGFVKAVCGGLGVAMSTGRADDIVAYFRDAANQWDQITDTVDGDGNVTKRKEQAAKEAADAGQLVIGGLTSGELDDDDGHVVIVISAPLQGSPSNGGQLYPIGYWGQLHGTGGANKIISYAFTSDYLNKVTYAAKSF